MSNLDLKVAKEMFARLFVISVQNKINFFSFTKMLEKSKFVEMIEEDTYSEYINKSLELIFFDITNKTIDKDNSYGVFNDAYWCGYSYFELHQKTKRSFSLIFLKLPFSKMMDIYSIYHEMDFSSLLEYFYKLDEGVTILRALCKERGCSLPKLCLSTGINKSTLSKYNASDKALLSGSFQNIYRISKYFDVPFTMFLI